MNLLNSWYEEQRSAYFYHLIVQYETHPLRKRLFENLAKAAEEQSEIIEKKLSEAHFSHPEKFYPLLRDRIIAFLLTQFGPERLRYILSAMKVRGMSVFNSHHEERHRSLSSANNLRAAVFGINDGLISNMSLILGVIGAQATHTSIIVAAIAGLLAGACSMGAGEYISVRSQREVFEYQIALERDELELYPEEEIQELALIYEARGIPKTDAESMSRLLISYPETALDTLAREELGLNPSELVSPLGAMLSSFFSFCLGGLIPLIPFLLGNHVWTLPVSLILTAVALMSVGALLSLYTNRSVVWSGVRMLCIGSLAGVLTYVIGGIVGRIVF